MEEDGGVIWITGLSAAGKTTLARALLPHLRKNRVLLDGDDMREALGYHAYDADSRRQLAMTYARLARMLARQGLIVVVATIALFHEVHAWNRDNQPNYLEVFLDVPEEVRRARDPKGLYRAARKGELKNLAGADAAVEFPLRPDIHVRHDEGRSIEELVRLILERCG